MSASEIIEELKENGSASIKKVLMKHGAREPFFGVKVEYLKKIQKRVKMDYLLSLALYETGISDAMYLAALIADDQKMTKEDLEGWVESAYWSLLNENAVPWVAAGSRYGRELALEWIDAPKETTAIAGWATYSSLLTIKPDSELDLYEVQALLARVEQTIHTQPDRVRYNMNGFVICVGSYVAPLAEAAMETAKRIGKVSVDVGDTSCRVSYAPDSIQKVWETAGGGVAKKRKTVKC